MEAESDSITREFVGALFIEYELVEHKLCRIRVPIFEHKERWMGIGRGNHVKIGEHLELIHKRRGVAWKLRTFTSDWKERLTDGAVRKIFDTMLREAEGPGRLIEWRLTDLE